MQIKTIAKCHITPVKMTIIKKQQITSVSVNVEIKETLCDVGGNVT